MTFTQRILSGTSQLMVSNGAVRLLSVVSMPILTSLLSPQAYGVAALVGTVISLVSVVALAGIDMSYARLYNSAQPPNGMSVERYCWRFAVLCGLISALVAALGWWFFAKHTIDQDGRLAVVVGLGIIFSVTCTMVLTRTRLAGRYGAMALTIIGTGIICLAASIVIATVWRRDAMALVIPVLLGYLIPIVLLGAPSIGELAQRSGLSRSEGAALLKIGLAGVVTSPMYWLVSSSDRWFLQHYHTAATVGLYAVGYSIATAGMMVNNAITLVWLPEAAREFEESPAVALAAVGQIMSRLAVLMALVWLAIAAAGGDIVRWFANIRFHAAAEYVPYIAAGVFFHGVLNLANGGLLLAKELNWAAIWWLMGGAVCTLLNLLLVPNYGSLGAAITQAVSFGFIALGILMTCQLKFPLDLDWSRFGVALGVILPTGIFLAHAWHPVALLSLLMKLPIGISVAVVVIFVTAPDWCDKGVQYLRGQYAALIRLARLSGGRDVRHSR